MSVTSTADMTRTGGEVLRRGLGILGQGIAAQPRLFSISVAGSVLHGALLVGNAYVVGEIVGRVVTPAFAENRIDTGALALAAAVLLGISGLRVAAMFARRLAAGAMMFRLQAGYRERITRRYLELPLAWHQRNSAGSLLSTATSDVEAAVQPFAPLPLAVGTVVMLVGALGSVLWTDWVLGLVGLVLVPSLFALNIFYSRRMSPLQMRAQRLRAGVAEIAHESFDGALVIKTMGKEAAETARFAAKVGELRDGLIRVGRLRGLFDPVMDALPSVGTVAVLLLGTWRLSTGAITVSQLVSVAFLFTVLAFPLRAIAWLVGDMPRGVAGYDRVHAVLAAEGSTRYGNDDVNSATPARLDFENVGFSYADGEPVLRDVTLSVPAGKTVALVGPTGSGKSTIASLAVRLVDPDAGTVRLDGADLRTLTAEALAANIALVPQLPFVFDDTIRANIALDRPAADDAEVWAALRLAQIDSFVAGLPASLDTEVGERGTSLSGGQRQRLTLARALAGYPRLLILDDATSAVDPRVEAAILGALRSAAGEGASILVVAYRRATIALADEVVYLESGRILARGTHTELLATVPGYKDLVTAYEKAEALDD
ncbi:ABC-type multidrug transport system fused ATPase/permease subunit [Catenuloplanes indicus]|uniref:ABC-type multidrug transport system fused ATPase/permease subunit n=2 Tax=Catenuloplanes indicus TaxID=137267 RepID=A0AAE3VY17_9ACTN|nr:ABC-type multidrug transport system fused ATPase/permease subunit [Catenuloplanes indicus]